jgi:predicted MFS family arabinose efflux permease
MSPPPTPAELPEAERARGRRLAWTSHPAGMTHRYAFMADLPTLALLSLGAGEAVVGAQRALERIGQLLQLPTLRAVGVLRKRTILVCGQSLAVVGGLPFVAFGWLATREDAIPLALASLATATVGVVVGQTVWFPLLRGYVEADRIGRFFGLLRTSWHLALIAYYLGARSWLAAHPGSFGPLFGVAWLFGAARVALIARLPERSERTGERIRVREAFELLRTHPSLRRYLLGVTWTVALRLSVVPFAIVMMRREVGFGEGQVVLTTASFFAGGFVSLYVWGRVVDRIGPAPVFLWTSLGMAALFASLTLVSEPGTATLVAMTGFFFALAVLNAGFGVADTHVLFSLTPPEAPARTLVMAQLVTTMLDGGAPLVAGLVLDRALAATDAPLAVFHAFFATAALLQCVAFLPLRGFDASR